MFAMFQFQNTAHFQGVIVTLKYHIAAKTIGPTKITDTKVDGHIQKDPFFIGDFIRLRGIGAEFDLVQGM